MRGFEKVSTISKGIIPKRATKSSAGYDFHIIDSCEIKPFETVICPTGIKAYMNEDEYLALFIRSSVGIKKGLILANITGIIDSDYYNNFDNEGHILIALKNTTSNTVTLDAGERIAQGIFQKYLLTTDDNSDTKRIGGIGSTKK